MILYVNGDSYAFVSDGKRYSDYLGELLQCTSINAAISGSCNSRIFRTSLRDLIELKKTTDKDIVAVIALSFTIRTELWDRAHQLKKWRTNNDGDFLSLQFATVVNWFSKKDQTSISDDSYKHYSRQWLEWFDIEAETTKLLQEIILLTSWCDNNNIKYVLFSSVLQEPIDFTAPCVNSFNELVNSNKNIINIFKQSFTEYCINNGHIPIDDYSQEIHGKKYIIGHHGEEAHKDFAKYIFENYLK
jgi:hypothetical protein